MDLLLTCHLNIGGLSAVAQELYKCFRAEGLRVVTLFTTEPEEAHVDPAIAAEMMAASTRQLDSSPLQFHVGIPESLFLAKGREWLVLSTVVEGPTLTSRQLASCAAADLVLPPSRFCQEALLSSGVPRKKVALVPYPLDLAAWNPGVQPSQPRDGRFRFLFMNTLYERKGWDIMLRAWWEEFSEHDPVELVIKSHREDTRSAHLEGLVARVATAWRVNRAARAPVRAIDAPIDAAAVPGFIKSHDALVSPHRAECFGMNPWHAMALGVPVICTRYGGPIDFATDETAWLVDVGRMGIASPEEVRIFPQFEGMRWAEPSVDSLRAQMRSCLRDEEGRARRAAAGARLVAARHAPVAVMRRLRDALPPGSWEKLGSASTPLEDQPSPRFEGGPIDMVEI